MYLPARLSTIALVACLAALPNAARASDGGPERSTLDTGATLVTRQRPGSQVVAISVAVRAGARFEDEQTAGAARLVQSALTLGTRKRPTRDQILRALSARGGSLEVAAGRELLEVTVVAGLPDLDLAADVIEDVLFDSRFDPAAFEGERAVILHELDEREDDPESVAEDALFDTVFAGHPLSRRPSGTKSAVERLSVDLIATYWKARLVGPNVTVAVVSGLPHDETLARLSSLFGRLPAGPPTPSNDAPLPSRPGVVREVEAGSDQSVVIVAAPVGGRSSQWAELQILREVLGRSSGRLYSEIRDRRGLAYSTSASVIQYADAGVFFVYAATEASNADRVADLLRSELVRLTEEPVSEEEARTAVGGIVGSQAIAEERSRAEAVALGRRTAFGLPSREEAAALLRAVSVADLQQVAREVFVPERLTTIITRPAAERS